MIKSILFSFRPFSQWIPWISLQKCFTPTQTLLFCNKRHWHMLICYERNWCFLHNGRSCWTSAERSRVSSISKQRQSRLRAFFLPGRKADKSYPSYMYVNVHLRNSLKINVHSQLTYSLFLGFFFQCKFSLVTTVLSTSINHNSIAA